MLFMPQQIGPVLISLKKKKNNRTFVNLNVVNIASYMLI